MAHIEQTFSGDATQDEDYTNFQVITADGSLYLLRMTNAGVLSWELVV